MLTNKSSATDHHVLASCMVTARAKRAKEVGQSERRLLVPYTPEYVWYKCQYYVYLFHIYYAIILIVDTLMHRHSSKTCLYLRLGCTFPLA